MRSGWQMFGHNAPARGYSTRRRDRRARSLRLQKARFLQHCVLYIALVLRVRSARRAADKRQNASAAQRLGIAVPLFSDIRVATSCPDGYSRPIENAMDEFGAAVLDGISDSADAVIDLDSSPEKFVCGGEVFTAGKITLTSAYARLMPTGADSLEFAGALYLISRIHSLAQLCFSEIYHGGKPLSLRAASELIRLSAAP